MRQLSFIVFFLLGTAAALSAQNPFEIIDRLDTTRAMDVTEEELTFELTDTTASTTSAEVDRPNEIDTTNPFEIVSRAEVTTAAVVEKSAPPTSTERPDSVEEADSQNTSKNGTNLFILLLLTLIPTTILFTVFRSHLRKAVDNLMQSGILTRSYREYAGASIVPMNSWFVLFLINAGLFTALVLRHYGILLASNLLWHVGICIIGMSVFILFKRALLSFLGVLFPIQKQINLYLYVLMVFSILVGVFLTLANVSLLYILEEGVNVLIYSSFAILFILYAIRTYRGLLVVNQLALLHTFHFLLYICTVEIAPIFVLTKLVMLYGK